MGAADSLVKNNFQWREISNHVFAPSNLLLIGVLRMSLHIDYQRVTAIPHAEGGGPKETCPYCVNCYPLLAQWPRISPPKPTLTQYTEDIRGGIVLSCS